MIDVGLRAAGVLGPGLPGWPATRAVLRGEAPYAPAAAAEPVCTLLPANERRRVSRSVRWALAVGQEVLAAQHSDGADIATVFASCGGDGAITHQICEALAAPTREVSPTRFHNSVHNAPAGYWSIATGSTMPSTSLCAYQASFAAGLLEAAAQVQAETRRVLLIVYDLPYPQPMHALWPVEHPLAVALLLEPACGSGMRLRLATGTGAAQPEWPEMLPRQLASNPASHALPLLAALARGSSTRLRLPYLGDHHLAAEIGT